MEAVQPRIQPTLHAQPRQGRSAIAPPPAKANMSFSMRSNPRSGLTVITRVPHQLPYELDEAGYDAQDQERDVKPVRAERLVQQPTDRVADKGGDRQHERERSIL